MDALAPKFPDRILTEFQLWRNVKKCGIKAMHFGCNFAHQKVNYHFCHTKDNPLHQDKICKLQAAWYETAPSPHPQRELKNKIKEEPKKDYGEIQQSISRKLVDILWMQIKLIMSFASRKSTCNHLKKIKK